MDENATPNSPSRRKVKRQVAKDVAAREYAVPQGPPPGWTPGEMQDGDEHGEAPSEPSQHSAKVSIQIPKKVALHKSKRETGHADKEMDPVPNSTPLAHADQKQTIEHASGLLIEHVMPELHRVMEAKVEQLVQSKMEDYRKKVDVRFGAVGKRLENAETTLVSIQKRLGFSTTANTATTENASHDSGVIGETPGDDLLERLVQLENQIQQLQQTVNRKPNVPGVEVAGDARRQWLAAEVSNSQGAESSEALRHSECSGEVKNSHQGSVAAGPGIGVQRPPAPPLDVAPLPCEFQKRKSWRPPNKGAANSKALSSTSSSDCNTSGSQHHLPPNGSRATSNTACTSPGPQQRLRKYTSSSMNPVRSCEKNQDCGQRTLAVAQNTQSGNAPNLGPGTTQSWSQAVPDCQSEDQPPVQSMPGPRSASPSFVSSSSASTSDKTYNWYSRDYPGYEYRRRYPGQAPSPRWATPSPPPSSGGSAPQGMRMQQRVVQPSAGHQSFAWWNGGSAPVPGPAPGVCRTPGERPPVVETRRDARSSQSPGPVSSTSSLSLLGGQQSSSAGMLAGPHMVPIGCADPANA